MKNKGFEEGYRKKILIKRGWNSAGAGKKTVIPLDDLPCYDSDLVVCVNGLEIVTPDIAVTLTGSKDFDGVSMAQVLSNVGLFMATGAPPSKAAGGSEAIIDSIDGYRALSMLGFLSDRNTIRAAGAEVSQDNTVASADVTDPASGLPVSTMNTTRRRGWLQDQGPIVRADATATSAVAFVPRFFLPFGYVYGEDSARTAVPAAWLNGKQIGDRCKGGRAGRLEIVLGTTIDNLSVTYGGTSATFDIWAHCTLVPRSKIPCPAVPRLVAYKAQDKNFKCLPGIRRVLSFMKELTTAGAMQQETYTRVKANCDGRQLNEDDVAENISFLSEHEIEREHYRLPAQQVAKTGIVVATRYTRAGTPILIHEGSALRSPGSLDAPTVLDITSTTETTHDVIDFIQIPVTDEVRAAASDWAGGGDTMPVAANGNNPAPQQKDALPHVTYKPPA